MQINKFNPQMTAEEFRLMLKSKTTVEKASEEQIRNAAFAALAKTPVETLSAGLESDIVNFIQTCAYERAKQITACVRKLNQVGDDRDDLLTNNDLYKKLKEALKGAKEAFFVLSSLDSQEAEKVAKEISETDMKLSDVFVKFKRNSDHCVCASPIAMVEHAVTALVARGTNEDSIENSKEYQKKNDNLCSAMKLWFLDNDSKSTNDLREHICSQFFLCNFIINILNYQLPIAKRKAEDYQIEQQAEREEKIVANKEKLSRSIGLYQTAKEKLAFDQSYQEYRIQKKSAFDELQKLSIFCTLSEFTEHPKIAKESVALVYRTNRS